MIRILITTKPGVENPIEGCITLVYGEEGMNENAYRPLVSVDFKTAMLTDKQKAWILLNTPARFVPFYEQQWATEKLKFIIEECQIEFEADFWRPYGHKVNKALVLKEWSKLPATEQSEAAAGLMPYLRYLSRNQWRTKADPITYLKKKMWKNDWDNLN